MDFILTRNRFCPYITAKEIMGWILCPGILEYYLSLDYGVYHIRKVWVRKNYLVENTWLTDPRKPDIFEEF